MSLNVNYNSLYKHGIDTSILKDVSNEILRRAAQKNSRYTNSANIQNVNTNTKPVELGIDLYQGKINSEVQKQIAMNNTLQFQFNQDTLTSIQYLNSQAAQNIQKNVEGKITVALNEGVGNSQKTEASPKFNSIVSLSTGKDKNGSAPSYKGEFLFIKKDKDKEETAAV